MKYDETNQFYKNRHSCFLLQYHLVLVTKYRKKVINSTLKDDLYAYTGAYFKDRDINILEFNGESDHIHILFEAYPQMDLAKFINAFKSASSRYIRKTHSSLLSRYYYKPYFWSLSYFICTVSERNTKVVQNYIKYQQG